MTFAKTLVAASALAVAATSSFAGGLNTAQDTPPLILPTDGNDGSSAGSMAMGSLGSLGGAAPAIVAAVVVAAVAASGGS